MFSVIHNEHKNTKDVALIEYCFFGKFWTSCLFDIFNF
jgi:hypothetical protein